MYEFFLPMVLIWHHREGSFQGVNRAPLRAGSSVNLAQPVSDHVIQKECQAGRSVISTCEVVGFGIKKCSSEDGAVCDRDDFR